MLVKSCIQQRCCEAKGPCTKLALGFLGCLSLTSGRAVARHGECRAGKHAVRDKPICKASMCSSYLSKYRAMRILSSFSIGFKCPCSCTTNHNTERSIFDMRFIEADDRTCYFQII